MCAFGLWRAKRIRCGGNAQIAANHPTKNTTPISDITPHHFGRVLASSIAPRAVGLSLLRCQRNNITQDRASGGVARSEECIITKCYYITPRPCLATRCARRWWSRRPAQSSRDACQTHHVQWRTPATAPRLCSRR